MNILVIGSGAVGIGLAASMLSQGVNVSIFARGKTACEIQTNGIRRTGLFTNYSFSKDEVNVYEDYSKIPKNTIDYVFIATKTTANDDISQKLSENRDILKENSSLFFDRPITQGLQPISTSYFRLNCATHLFILLYFLSFIW